MVRWRLLSTDMEPTMLSFVESLLMRSPFDAGADTNNEEEERGRSKLSPPLQIPKNRSTGNLAVGGNNSEKARIRLSFDAGAAAAEYDAITR